LGIGRIAKRIPKAFSADLSTICKAFLSEARQISYQIEIDHMTSDASMLATKSFYRFSEHIQRWSEKTLSTERRKKTNISFAKLLIKE